MEFTFDPAYGRPKRIAFSGDVYEKIDIKLSSMEDTRGVGVAVALTPENDDEEEPEHDGPDVILFNRTVYHKTARSAATLKARILHTVPAPSPFMDYSEDEDADMEDVNSSDAQLVRNHQASISRPELRSPTPSPSPPPPPRTVSAPTTRTPAIIPATRTMSAAPTRPVATTQVGRIHLPPRSPITDSTPLEYGFDLPSSVRNAHGTRFIEPLKHSRDYLLQRGITITPGTSIPLSNWPEEVVQYAWDLVELAMLQKNRKLTYTEFRVVTEASHRRFTGMTLDGKLYVEKGYNNVHSKVYQDKGYKDMIARVLA